ncbi:hypothetical protein CEXT_316841 [Caerostris extrusa]|uniref:Uncharacterized protein n=1 Tax=Caerostris extrusa TaxID=172846 RepID=A0AAV4WSZ9_CAEEX|nr:hypothetical protein CEXT_316841 [Caerostris extrusa]
MRTVGERNILVEINRDRLIGNLDEGRRVSDEMIQCVSSQERKVFQCSSGNVAEDIELLTADEMEDEALWPFGKQSDSSTLNQINQPLNQINQPLNQINNSRQQSISSRLRRDGSC